MQDKNKQHFIVIAVMILIAASTRFLLIPNFTAVGAMGLFGAAYFNKKYMAFIVPFVALFLSDLVLNNVIYAQYYDGFVLFSQGALSIYLGFAAVVLLGMGLLKKVKPLHLLGASLSASVVFFLITNFGTWATGILYPMNGAGLLASYVAGLPFLPNTIAGDLFFSSVLFGVYEYAVKPRFNTASIS